MRLTRRDAIASVLVALIAIPYIGYLINGSAPFVEDPRGMSAVGLILGTAAFLVMRAGDERDRYGWGEIGLAGISLVLGLIALIFAETAAAEALLAVFMISILVVFAVELVEHAGYMPGHHPAGAGH